jgi:murein DD-endopeptidase MepM/ murein hydrolase activator NlpD
VGRHSPALAPETPVYRVPDTTRLTRSQERALARSQAKRVTWRRYTAIPVTCALVGLYFADDAFHIVSHPASASSQQSLGSPADFSALATGAQATSLLQNTERVSRSKRTDSALDAGSTALPARPGMPKVDPYKTVAGNWVRPSQGEMSTCFCMRWGVFHDGIDLAGPLGSPILATGDGVVLESGPAEGFGHWIVIQQSNGDVTIYGHMFSELVSKGDHVKTGDHIANIGDDGEATGPHLHFGVRKGGITGPYIDPVPWLRARGVTIGSYDPNA